MKICVFGDSIAWGACDFEKGGWVECLKIYCMAKDNDVDVYNLGISNDDTEKMLRRFDFEASVRKPDFIMFAVGINDASCLGSKDTPRILLGSFRSNMVELIKKAKTIADTVICVGLTRVDEVKTMPIPYAPDQYYTNERIMLYDKEIESLCVEKSISYITVANLLTKEDLEDGIHPNAVGHEKMFQAMKAALESYTK
jgi:lysophospholipase L1-like esterase